MGYHATGSEHSARGYNDPIREMPMEVTEYISRVSKCPELSTVCTSLLFLQFFDPQVFCSVALCYDDDILCSEYRHVLYVVRTREY